MVSTAVLQACVQDWSHLQKDWVWATSSTTCTLTPSLQDVLLDVKDMSLSGNSACHVVEQVSGDSVDEYKQNIRDGLRRLLDPPVDPLGGPVEWVIVYVKPSTVDHLSKGPSKVSQHCMLSLLLCSGVVCIKRSR
jgi:hypothetical protein